MTDVFNVTAAWDKASYNVGDLMTGTISGQDVVTSQSSVAVGPITIPIVNPADNATSTVTLPSVTVMMVTTQPQSVVIDTTRPIVDSSSTQRNWVVSANKLSITATA